MYSISITLPSAIEPSLVIATILQTCHFGYAIAVEFTGTDEEGNVYELVSLDIEAFYLAGIASSNLIRAHEHKI